MYGTSIVRSLLVSLALAAGLIVAASPAQAAPFVVCDSWPAPTISGSAGVITAHYYHECTTVDGVTDMFGEIWIVKVENGVQIGRFVVSAPQRTAAGTVQAGLTEFPGALHGKFYALETLEIFGTFTSGPPAHSGFSCGRETPTSVFCHGESVPVNF